MEGSSIALTMMKYSRRATRAVEGRRRRVTRHCHHLRRFYEMVLLKRGTLRAE